MPASSTRTPTTDRCPPTLVSPVWRRRTTEALGGIVYARGGNKRTLGLAAVKTDASGAKDVGFYELDAALHLVRSGDGEGLTCARKNYAFCGSGLTVDAASAVMVDDA
jgi:hypothetical protein